MPTVRSLELAVLRIAEIGFDPGSGLDVTLEVVGSATGCSKDGTVEVEVTPIRGLAGAAIVVECRSSHHLVRKAY